MSSKPDNINVLMLSHRDRSLVGEKAGGDSAERHALYGERVQFLDIIMHSARDEDLPVHRLARNVTVYPTNSLRRVFFPRDAYTIAAGIAQNHQPDLIVTQDPFMLGWVGVRLKRKYDVPLLAHFHGDFWDDPYFRVQHPRNRLLLPLSRKVVKEADAVRAVSPLIAEKIKKEYPKKHVEVISTPVNLERFEKADTERIQRARAEYGKGLILYVGRLEAEKNVQLLLDAFELIQKQMPRATLLIIGRGSELGMLRGQVKDKGWEDKVFFRGNVEHEDLPAYYHSARVFVLPSNTESFGKVILEAAASKLPTVATATTGAKTLIKDTETGLLVPIGGPQKLAKKILQVLRNEDLQEKLGQAAYQHAKANFSREDNIEKITRLWHQIVNSHKSP